MFVFNERRGICGRCRCQDTEAGEIEFARHSTLFNSFTTTTTAPTPYISPATSTVSRLPQSPCSIPFIDLARQVTLEDRHRTNLRSPPQTAQSTVTSKRT